MALDGDLRVDTGVPIPKRVSPDRTVYNWPFKRMKPGQSFELPIKHEAALWAAMRRFRVKHPGWRFTTRRGVGSIRCWRVE